MGYAATAFDFATGVALLVAAFALSPARRDAWRYSAAFIALVSASYLLSALASFLLLSANWVDQTSLALNVVDGLALLVFVHALLHPGEGVARSGVVRGAVLLAALAVALILFDPNVATSDSSPAKLMFIATLSAFYLYSTLALAASSHPSSLAWTSFLVVVVATRIGLTFDDLSNSPALDPSRWLTRAEITIFVALIIFVMVIATKGWERSRGWILPSGCAIGAIVLYWWNSAELDPSSAAFLASLSTRWSIRWAVALPILSALMGHRAFVRVFEPRRRPLVFFAASIPILSIIGAAAYFLGPVETFEWFGRPRIAGAVILLVVSATIFRVTSRVEQSSAEPDRFQIERLLGRGASGDVYLAFDRALARQVTLKRFATNDPADARLEAHALRAAAHRHVIELLDETEDKSGVTLVMEYASGGSVRERLLSPRPITKEEALNWVRGTVDALVHLHARAFVHRDVKPENVLLTADGDVRLADFGLSRPATTSRTRTLGYGTLGYVAPEQQRGECAGPAADVYSAAVFAFEVFARADVRASGPLNGLLTKAVSQAPQDRPSAQEILIAVEANLDESMRAEHE